jgi:hypothetical protein
LLLLLSPLAVRKKKLLLPPLHPLLLLPPLPHLLLTHLLLLPQLPQLHPLLLSQPSNNLLR